MALIIYIGIFLIVFCICKYRLQYQSINILLPLIILNTIPVTNFPGSLTPMYAVDLMLPIIIIYFMINIKKMAPDSGFLRVTFFLYLVIPILSLIFSLIRWIPDSISWITYLYHKITIFSIILMSYVIYRKVNLIQVINVATIFWICLCFVGMGHYFGYYYADVVTPEDGMEASIFQNSWLIQGGFMGLNRGATGVFASTFLSYSLSRLLYSSKFLNNEKLIHIVCCLFSIMIFFLSGSRSGLVAALGANILIFIFALARNKRLNAKFLIPIVAGFIFFLLYVSSTSILDRFSLTASEESGTDRLKVQVDVFDNSFSDVQSFFIGNVARPFSDLGNYLTHPHSDYFQTLWDYGWIGVIVYLVLLRMIFRQLRRQIFEVNFSLFASFIASLIGGLTIGNLMIGSSRLLVYICFMVFIYAISYLKNKEFLRRKYSTTKFDNK